jgi:hypothetical protein
MKKQIVTRVVASEDRTSSKRKEIIRDERQERRRSAAPDKIKQKHKKRRLNRNHGPRWLKHKV